MVSLRVPQFLLYVECQELRGKAYLLCFNADYDRVESISPTLPIRRADIIFPFPSLRESGDGGVQ